MKALPAPGLVADDLEPNESEQRRGYGLVDMRFDPCIAHDGDYILRGKNCASGILVYGPYVTVPQNSQIEVSFDVQPDQTIQVYADAVAQMGRQVLAGLNPQVVSANENQRLGYFVNVQKGETYVEARIGFRAEHPVGFVLSNFLMTVR